jgi:hypothetical protein
MEAGVDEGLFLFQRNMVPGFIQFSGKLLKLFRIITIVAFVFFVARKYETKNRQNKQR